MKHAQLQISLDNVAYNLKYFRSKLKDSTKLLVLIKANSYGHGAVPFAKLMEEEGVDYLAVATPLEGVELRKGGIKLPILVLTTGTGSYADIIQYELEPGVPSLEYLKILAAYLKENNMSSYPIHINIDTGMHRLGFQNSEIQSLKNFLVEHPQLKVKSIYSHLAASDEVQHDEFTECQVSEYNRLSEDVISVLGYRPICHILNSAGIERFSHHQKDMVRLGIGIYGISAVNDKVLRPSAYFKAPVVQVKRLTDADGTVGYGRWGKLDSDIKEIITLPVGYADGINRRFGRGAVSFELNGKLCPTIGNICMDMCMLDATGANPKVGDVVTIFGDVPHANDHAKILGTIPYEIFTSVAARVEKVYICKK